MSWLFGAGKAAAAPAAASIAEASVDMKEKQREWQRSLLHQQRDLDRNIREIEREEAKVKINIKKAVKDNQMRAAKDLAKNILLSKKAKERLLTCKVHLEGIGLELKAAVATLKVTGAMQRSGEIMKSMNALVKVSETSAACRELAKEMTRFGIMEEMVSEQIDSALDADGDLDELADAQVEALVQEILSGVKATGSVGQKQLQGAEAEHAAAAAEIERRIQELGK
jgi:charged multivesicular body protein 3